MNRDSAGRGRERRFVSRGRGRGGPRSFSDGARPRGRSNRSSTRPQTQRQTPRQTQSDRAQSRETPEKQPAREHPKVRTAHGTRVARSIKCARCGATDILHFIPRHETQALCRNCAAETLEVPDRDAGILPPEPVDPENLPPAPPPPSDRVKTAKGVIRVRRRSEED